MSDSEKKCPKCAGPMWDNRDKKTNPKAPDFKCRDKEKCDGVIWPPRERKMAAGTTDDPGCPVCGGQMWDNRKDKRNPKSPDFKCRDKDCTGVIWPPKDGEEPTGLAKKKAPPAKAPVAEAWEDFVPPGSGNDEDEDMPF